LRKIGEVQADITRPKQTLIAQEVVNDQEFENGRHPEKSPDDYQGVVSQISTFFLERNASSVTLVAQMNIECAARRMLHPYLSIVVYNGVNKFHF
jgi:hypothetical protein